MRLASLAALLCSLPSLAFGQQPITTGADADYQPAIVRTADGTIVVVFERLNPATFSGDLWTLRSTDGGATWTAPAAVVASASNERHPALVQLGDGSFVLFYLKGASAASSFRVYRATSSDGVAYTEAGALALGWTTGGEINPHVTRHPDGTLTMSYQRLGSGSYVAQSSDNGATWDTLRTPIATGSQLPRIAFRASDGVYLATYQVGTAPLALYAKTTTNVRDWSGAPHDLAVDGDNHDSLPIVMPDGAFVVFHIHGNDGQYDVYSRRSVDGVTFEPSLAHVETDDANDVEPHPLVGTSANRVDLYWGRESPLGSSDYDIWQQRDTVVADAVFRNGYE